MSDESKMSHEERVALKNKYKAEIEEQAKKALHDQVAATTSYADLVMGPPVLPEPPDEERRKENERLRKHMAKNYYKKKPKVDPTPLAMPHEPVIVDLTEPSPKRKPGRPRMSDEEKEIRRQEILEKKREHMRKVRAGQAAEPGQEGEKKKRGGRPRLPPRSLEYMLNNPSKEARQGASALQRGGRVSVIEQNWDNVVKMCHNGWSFKAIGNVLGLANNTLTMWCRNNPEKYKILATARMRLHDDMVNVLIAHAKSGRSNSWLPAITILERLFWTTWCRPEVKLQMMQMEQNTNETVQTFGGKTLRELAKEIRQAHGDNPNFKEAVQKLQTHKAVLERDGFESEVADELLGDNQNGDV